MSRNNLLDDSITIVPSSVLKPSQKSNLLGTPIQCRSGKVSFVTPLRTASGHLKTGKCKDGFSFVNSKQDKFHEELEGKSQQQWRERIEVLTKQDHEDYVNSAKVILDEIIIKAVNIAENKREQKSKKSNLKLTQNTTSKNQIVCPDDGFTDGALFMEAGTDQDWDMLASRGSTSSDCEIVRKSLYEAFDPLFSRQQTAKELPRKSDIIDFVSYVPTNIRDADKSRVTKSSVDFFFESPPALEVIKEEDAFQFEQKQIEEEKTDNIDTKPTEIIEVLKYSSNDIAKILEEHKQKWMAEQNKASEQLVQKNHELKIASHLSCEALTKAEHTFDINAKMMEESKNIVLNLKQQTTEIINLTEELQKTVVPNIAQKVHKIREKIKNHNSNMHVLQSCTYQYYDSAPKFYQNEDEVKSLQVEKESILKEAKQRLNTIKSIMIRKEVEKNGLEKKLQTRKIECVEYNKICDEYLH